MTYNHKLVIGLSIGLAVKIAVLIGLWFVFVKDRRQTVDTVRMETLFFPRR